MAECYLCCQDSQGLSKITESNLSQGTTIRSNNNISSTAIAMIANSNVLSLIEPSGMNVEYTQDGGMTWIDYQATDDNKRGACDNLRPATLQLGKRSRSDTASDGLRITINAVDALIFCRAQYLVFVTVGSMQFKLEFANKNSSTTFTEKYISTVSGTTSVPLNGELFGSSSDSDNYVTVMRLTFIANRANNGYFVNRLQLYSDLIYGNSGLNSLARYGHLYKWDFSQNATFPANVTATTFIGDLNGNANTATNSGSAGKAGAVVDNGDSNKTIQIGWTGDSLTSDNFEYIAGYSKAGNIKDVQWDAVNSKVVPKKSEGVVDYTDSTKTIQIGWTGDSLSSSEIKYPAAYSTSGNIKDTTWDTFRDKLSLSPRFQLMDGTDLFPTNYELAMNPSSNRAGGSIRYGTWTPSIAKAASYEYRYGSWIKLGNVVTLSFSIKFTAETIPSSTAIQFRILGCPFTPVSQYSAGGGTLSGYYASDNLVFSGYVIDKSDSNAIYAVAQWATAAGYKYTTPCAIGSESQHIASGTIQFISID